MAQEMGSLPKMLEYTGIKPRGFPQKFKRHEVMPESTNENYAVSDVIRFQLKTSQFIDPYQSYMEIEVEFPKDQTTMPEVSAENTWLTSTSTLVTEKLCDVPAFILDGPATSLISEFILYSNGKEVERIMEYDTLGNILADIGVPGPSRATKSYEGYAYDRIFPNSSEPVSSNWRNIVTNSTKQAGSVGFFEKEELGEFAGTESEIVHADILTGLALAAVARNALDPFGNSGSTIYASVGKCYENFAREYILNDGEWGVDHEYTENTFPIDAMKSSYSTSADLVTSTASTAKSYQKRVAYNYASSINNFEYIAPGIHAIKYRAGEAITDYARGGVSATNDYENRDGISTRTFYVPILSGVLGHLIPGDQWRLIPGNGCGELTMEFRLNRYAFFSSGHRDNTDAATTAPTREHAMNWTVKKISLHMDLWEFTDDVTRTIDEQIESGEVVLTSQGFTLGPVHQLSSSASVRNNWQINNRILSLREIMVVFLADDYTKYNFCRRHFRLSHNLKSLELKIGLEYIPPIAIEGHAGNIVGDANNKDDVLPFLLELYRCTGEFLSTNSKTGIVPANFILNDRVYDIDNKEHTRNEFGWYEETRASGKAIYCIDTQSDPKDYSVLSGFDTTQGGPIEMAIDNYSGSGSFNRSSTIVLPIIKTITFNNPVVMQDIPEEMQLPKMLQYSTIKPKGFPSMNKRWEVLPLGENKVFNFSDVIRFEFSTMDYIDPYESYMQIEVEFDGSTILTEAQRIMLEYANEGTATGTITMTEPESEFLLNYLNLSQLPLFSLDGPATSVISEMILYSNNREIERIEEYDELGNILADIGMPITTRNHKQFEGFKYDAMYSNEKRLDYMNGYSGSSISAGTNYAASIEMSASHFGSKYSLAPVEDVCTSGTIPASSVLNQFGVENTFTLTTATGNIMTETSTFPNAFSRALFNIPVVVPYNYGVTVEGSGSNTTATYTDRATGQVAVGSAANRAYQDVIHIEMTNYAREYVLSDGEYGVDHELTWNALPLNGEIGETAASLSGSGTLERTAVLSGMDTETLAFFEAAGDIGPVYASSFSGSLDYTSKIIQSTNSTEGFTSLTIPSTYPTFNNLTDNTANLGSTTLADLYVEKGKKRVEFNSSSSYNTFQYLAPCFEATKWRNGKPVIDYKRGGEVFTENSEFPTSWNIERRYIERDCLEKRIFFVPVLSGVLGHLIPGDQWKLIPGKGCGTLMYEFRLNRYAFFASGHRALGLTDDLKLSKFEYDILGGLQITKISLEFDLWSFGPEVDNEVQQQLQQNIVMTSEGFSLGPTYSIASTPVLKGIWQINNEILSLKNLYLWFILDDYKTYNWCRKHYRISHNLKSLELKMGSEFFPENAIKGHAGNLHCDNVDNSRGDCVPFMVELERAHGEFLSTNQRSCITNDNFAVNERSYHPACVADTMCEFALYEEQRLEGKALFCIDLESDPFDTSVLSGIDTSIRRPVELELDVHAGLGDQIRPSTMYMYLHHDILVTFSPEGIEVVGYG